MVEILFTEYGQAIAFQQSGGDPSTGYPVCPQVNLVNPAGRTAFLEQGMAAAGETGYLHRLDGPPEKYFPHFLPGRIDHTTRAVQNVGAVPHGKTGGRTRGGKAGQLFRTDGYRHQTFLLKKVQYPLVSPGLAIVAREYAKEAGADQNGAGHETSWFSGSYKLTTVD
jgi:hypothetical protein